jgi:hypothetical protein
MRFLGQISAQESRCRTEKKFCTTGTDTDTLIREVENPHQIERVSRRKKMKTTFTARLIFELEKMFEIKKYLNAGERSNLIRL